MRKFDFDREKYIRVLKSEGIHTALTRLHHDLNQWEFLTFEGEAGYSPELWEQLKMVRNFSRELWDLSEKNQRQK
jgi:hypothetical protein